MRNYLLIASLLVVGCQDSPDLNDLTGPGPATQIMPSPMATPTITGVSPPLAATTGGTPITIAGTGFVKGATVRIAGQPAAHASWISDTQIQAMVPSRLGEIGPAVVQVQNPDGKAAQGEHLFSYYAGVVQFYPQMPYQGGFGPNAIQLEDLNGDQVPDMVVAYTSRGVEDGKNAVSVFLGQGGGTFTFDADYEAGQGLFSMVLADVTGDGQVDIVASNALDDTVSVFPGQGGGKFGARVDYKTHGGMGDDHPVSLAVGDFNHDGLTDIVTANLNSNSLTVFLARKDGGFDRKQQVLSLPPWALAAGDVNLDGKVDLAVTHYQMNKLTVLLGNGDGTFTAYPEEHQTGAFPYSVVMADMDGDRHLDLLVTNNQGNTMTVLLGKGDGSFDFGSAPYVGKGPKNVVIGDLNGDGIPDAVVPCYDLQQVAVLLWQRGGKFMPAMFFSTADSPFTAAIADINGDHLPDVIGGNTGGTFSVLLNSSM